LFGWVIFLVDTMSVGGKGQGGRALRWIFINGTNVIDRGLKVLFFGFFLLFFGLFSLTFLKEAK